jgi:vacuolar-type H+-ATPase subunit I/STV1
MAAPIDNDNNSHYHMFFRRYPMRLNARILAATTALLFTLPGVASEDYDHYEGESATSLEQAVANLSEYNNRLEKVLSGELTPEAMNEVHQLTYTLENALGKMDEELEDIAERLEKVHKASEHAAPDTVKTEGAVYLEKSRTIVK